MCQISCDFADWVIKGALGYLPKGGNVTNPIAQGSLGLITSIQGDLVLFSSAQQSLETSTYTEGLKHLPHLLKGLSKLPHIFKGLHDFFHMLKCLWNLPYLSNRSPVIIQLCINVLQINHLSWRGLRHSPSTQEGVNYFISTKKNMKHAPYDKSSFRTFHMRSRGLQICLFCQRGELISFLLTKKNWRPYHYFPRKSYTFYVCPRVPETFHICLRNSETCYICSRGSRTIHICTTGLQTYLFSCICLQTFLLSPSGPQAFYFNIQRRLKHDSFVQEGFKPSVCFCQMRHEDKA